VKAALLAAALALAGCAQGTIEVSAPDGSRAKVAFSRVGADTALTLTPEGALTYSSNPTQVAQQQAQDALFKALALGLTLAGGQPRPGSYPLPLVKLEAREEAW
jgi:hypothetical protein